MWPRFFFCSKCLSERTLFSIWCDCINSGLCILWFFYETLRFRSFRYRDYNVYQIFLVVRFSPFVWFIVRNFVSWRFPRKIRRNVVICVCVRVRVYIRAFFLFACTYVRAYVRVCKHACVFAHEHTYVRTCVSLCACTYVRALVRVYMRAFRRVYMRACVCAYVWLKFALHNSPIFVVSVWLTVVFYLQDHCDSVAILKIKESMLEEARRFEHDTDGTTDNQGEFFMQ